MSAVRIENLCFNYSQKQVLRDIAINVNKAEFNCIIGANGSGKTTLLRAINRFVKPKSGTIEVFNKPIADYSSRQFSKLLAMVTQDIPFDISYSVKDVVMMGRYPYRGPLGIQTKKDHEIGKAAMSFTDVEQLADRKIYELSGGERQRVFIARAICQEPEIMLLDEPTASLDLSHQISVMDLMEKLKNEWGITVIMVSHDINLAAMYSDRIILIKRGQVIQTGTPEEVINYKTLESVYGCPLLINKNPLGNFPQVSLVPGRYIGVFETVSQNEDVL